jgi:Uncharacterized stress protein (general stress protein 26)
MENSGTKETAESVISKQKIVYLGSVNENGFPEIRAMLAPRKREGIRTFYLTTNTSSSKISQFLNNSKASLYFCNELFFKGVLLTGEIQVLQDEGSKEMIWRKGDTKYYPGGVTDPDYCVLKFTAQSGRMYGNYSVVEFDIEQ